MAENLNSEKLIGKMIKKRKVENEAFSKILKAMNEQIGSPSEKSKTENIKKSK